MEELTNFFESNYTTDFSDKMSVTSSGGHKFILSTTIPMLIDSDDGGNGNYSSELDYTDPYTFTMANPEDMLNPSKRNPSFYHIVITHAVTFVIGIVGNLFAVFVMIGDRKSRNATNLFLVSLAVADILLLALCVPLEMLQYFLQFEDNGFICKMAKYVLLLSASASVLNLCAVSLERFIVIVFPMRSRSLCTLSNCRKAILVVWIGASVLALPVLLSKDGFMMTYKNNVTSVQVYYCETSDVGLAFAIYQFVILFAAPGILMMACYFFVIRELWRSTRNINILTNSQSIRRQDHKVVNYRSTTAPIDQVNNSNTSCGVKEQRVISPGVPSTTLVGEKSNQLPKAEIGPSSSTSTLPQHYHKSVKRGVGNQARGNKGESDVKKARRQVIKMLILVIVLFLICWGPKLILAIFLKLAVIFKLEVYSNLWYNLRVISSLIPFIHSCINPVIYSFMSKNFRRSMSRQFERIATICGCKRVKRGEGPSRNAIPLRSAISKTRKQHGPDANFSSNYYSISEAASTRHTEIHGVSTI